MNVVVYQARAARSRAAAASCRQPVFAKGAIATPTSR